MYHYSSCKNTRKNDKISSKKFMESIPYDKINPEKIRQNKNCYNNVKKIENKLTRLREITFAGYLKASYISNFIDNKGNNYGITYTKKLSPLYVFEDKRCYKRIPIFYKNKVVFVGTLSRRTYFWDTVVPCGLKKATMLYR